VIANAPVSGQTIKGYVDTGSQLWGALYPEVTLNTASQPAPAPSAGRIAYKGYPPNAQMVPWIESIETMKFDGSDVRRLVSSDQTNDGHVGTPVWSPDGTKLIFVSYRPLPSAPNRPAARAFVMDAANGANQQLVIQSGLLLTMSIAGSPRWSWDGTLQLLSALTTWPIAGEPPIDSFTGQCWSVWVMDANGGGQTPLTDGVPGLYPVWIGQRQIALISDQKDISIVDVIVHPHMANDTYPYKYDTGTLTTHSLDPTWLRSDLASSPKHGILAFTATPTQGSGTEIHLWNSGAGEWSIGQGRYPTFSPDGNWVAYSTPNYKLVRSDLSGQRQTVIASTWADYNDWSLI
jgi:Tol biopolymer transport system component